MGNKPVLKIKYGFGFGILMIDFNLTLELFLKKTEDFNTAYQAQGTRPLLNRKRCSGPVCKCRERLRIGIDINLSEEN